MNLAITLAVGDKLYGQYCLNWAISVKSQNPKAKIALLFQPSAIAGIEQYIESVFDYTFQLPDSEVVNPIEYAFKIKTELYTYATRIEADAYLFMDADTIMLSGRSIDEFFTELKDVDFTMWCNDVYDFATGKRMRDDYTFWCEPEDIEKTIMFGNNKKIPQVNSSFIYFKPTKDNWTLFQLATCVWDDATMPYKKYKEVKPDEFCFNVALAQLNMLPHQIPYYPIFFSFASEHFEEQYIRNWKAIGFAGDTKQQDGVIHLYNHNVEYYRQEFDIEEPFVVGLSREKKPKDRHPLVIEPTSKRTLFRRDEVVNSAGGIFNPDGVYIKDFGYVTIFRKEANMDFYKVGHNQATALPHLSIFGNGRDEHFELQMSKPEGVRFEDFRIVQNSMSADGNSFQVSHTIISKNLTPQMSAMIGISIVFIKENVLAFNTAINLPIEECKIEKNWVFLNEGVYMYCIYSISPYILFRYKLGNIERVWEPVSVFQPELDWFHKGQRICNSTRPVLIGDEYLMLFHTREAGIYFQGAVIIDAATKEITHYTKRSIPLRQYAEGFQPGLIYASGILYREDKNLLRIFFGEADSHSCSNDYKADEFVALVKQNPVDASNNNSVLELLKQNV